MSIKNDSLPLFVATFTVSEKEIVFCTFNQKIVVEAPFELIQQLVTQCDGTKTFDKVILSTEKDWDSESVKNLIQELFQLGVIADARNLSNKIWQVIKNPMLFPQKVSDTEVISFVNEAKERHRSCVLENACLPESNLFTEILKKRRSVRKFSDKSVSLEKVVGLLWSAYGEFKSEQDGNFHRTSPSAGALYPLVIHITLFKKTGKLCPGVYAVRYDEFGRVGFNLLSEDFYRFARAFLNPSGILEGIHGVITISGSFSATGKKYGDRSILYVSLEAGHVAQNVLLEATNSGLATLEIGGFLDGILSDSLFLSEEYNPLTTIAFGYEADDSHEKDLNLGLEVEWAVPVTDEYNPSFAIASVRVSKDRSWSHGRDASPKLALAKAISEAREWASCGSIPELVFSSYLELRSAVDPRSIINFHPEQYRLENFPFAPFNEKDVYAWTKAYNYKTGLEVYVLADHVYFPYFPETPYHAYANSSGCAAHPDKQTAIETATLELVERDSFMNAYMCKLELPSVNQNTLPKGIQKRISEITELGFEVWIKDHSLDLAPVVFVFAQNMELNFTTCASCSSFNIEHAVSQSLMEVEASVLSRLQNGSPKPIKAEDVAMPLDHGSFYGQKEHFRKADFLVEGKDIIPFEQIGRNTTSSWLELNEHFYQNKYELILIPLILSDNYGGNNDLFIFRSIVPGLVPMTFGYQQEPFGMKRLHSIAKKFAGRNFSYEGAVNFPHPFE